MIDTDQTFFIANYSLSKEEVSSPEKLKTLINEFRGKGYALTDGYAWPFPDPDNIISDSTFVDHKINEMCLKNSPDENIHFWRYPFEFTLIFLSDDEDGTQWLISVQNDIFMGVNNEFNFQNSLELIDVIRTLLVCYPPFYGCFSKDIDVFYTDEIFDLEINELYPINFYGSSYVKKLGHQRLLSTPAWRVEEIANGIFLIPSLQAIYDEDPLLIENIKEYLDWTESEQ